MYLHQRESPDTDRVRKKGNAQGKVKKKMVIIEFFVKCKSSNEPTVVKLKTIKQGDLVN